MLTYINFLNGLITLAIVLFGCLLGTSFLLKARRLHAKLLAYMGITMIFASLVFLNSAFDFIYVIITNNNNDNPYELVVILSWMWVPFVVVFTLYMGAEIIILQKKLLKRVLLFITLIMAIIFEFVLIFYPLENFSVIVPPTPGEDIYDVQMIIGSPIFYIGSALIIPVMIFCAIGYSYKSFKSKDIIRRKYLYLALIVLLYGGCGVIDGFVSPGIPLFFVRTGTMVGFWFWYLSLKEEYIRPLRDTCEKEIIVEESLFRVYQRPDHKYSEEEVTFHREKKICLVCKGEVGGFMFICKNCNALYCENCAGALKSIENVCWVCNTPIDPSKPSIPFRTEGEEKIKKKPKKNLKISK